MILSKPESKYTHKLLLKPWRLDVVEICLQYKRKPNEVGIQNILNILMFNGSVNMVLKSPIQKYDERDLCWVA